MSLYKSRQVRTKRRPPIAYEASNTALAPLPQDCGDIDPLKINEDYLVLRKRVALRPHSDLENGKRESERFQEGTPTA